MSLSNQSYDRDDRCNLNVKITLSTEKNHGPFWCNGECSWRNGSGTEKGK